MSLVRCLNITYIRSLHRQVIHSSTFYSMLFPYMLSIMVLHLVKYSIKEFHITWKVILVICAEWYVVSLVSPFCLLLNIPNL